MGWELNVDDQQQYTMAKVKIVTTADAEIATNYSVDDIVKHCYDAGLVAEAQRTRHEHPNGNGPVMAFAAQPNLVVNQNDNVDIDGVNNIVHGNFNTNPSVENSVMRHEHLAPLPDPVDLNLMMNNTQAASRRQMFPVHDDSIFQGFQTLGFNNAQSPEADNSGTDVDDTYVDPIEAQYAGGAYNALEFEEFLNYFG